MSTNQARMATGFLVTNLTGKFQKLEEIVRKHSLNKLYIHVSVKNLEPNFKRNQWISSRITEIYATTSQLFPNLDVRILLNGLKPKKCGIIKDDYKVDVFILPSGYSTEDVLFFTKGNKNLPVVVLDNFEDFENQKSEIQKSTELKLYDNVVLGGTFDRLHAGHKILLTEALLRCRKKLTVGVTDTCMLQSKVLWELIEPSSKRMAYVRDFVKDIDSPIECDVVLIHDLYGPTKSDPTFNMIVVSSETQRGGAKINELRANNNLNVLDVHVVELVDDNTCCGEEEHKISSSNFRMRLLGTRLKNPVANHSIPTKPYVIGLTGGIASGKSSIGKYLESLGAGLIDCDKIAHQLYKKGTETFKQVIEIFGKSVIGPDGEIDRKELGKIVFSDKTQLDKLNKLLWPSILQVALKEAQRMHAEDNKRIVILEAAVLLRAEWYRSVHEVWASIIPPTEAVKRLMERNGLTETEAKARLASQPTNSEQVAIANVVFSTQWSVEYTRKQVDKAWMVLKKSAKL